MEVLSIIDTAVKIGLGALISGVATYWVTKLNHSNDIAKTKLKRQRELVEEIAGQTEEFSAATLKYWAYMVEHVRYAEREKPAPDHLPARIKSAETELFDKFSKLASAEGKLILLGSSKAQELLRDYGEYIKDFRRVAWHGNPSLKEADLETYRSNILLKRKALYEEIRAAYA